MNAPMINVGAQKDAIDIASAAIIEILEVPNVDNLTKQTALQTLHTICSVKDVVIQNCNFTAPNITPIAAGVSRKKKP